MLPIPPSLHRVAEEIDGWLELKCHERALELLEMLLSDSSARPTGLTMRVRAYVGLSRHAEALADITELRSAELQSSSELGDWLDLCEAWCLKRTSDLRGAIRCMEQLVARSQQSDIGHYNLGCYLALAGDRDRAIEEVTIACGLTEELREHARDEPDLDCLRNDARFRELMRPRRTDV